MPVVAGTGYQYSLSEVRDQVRNFLMQTTAATSRWSDANLNTYINKALDDLRMAGVCEIARGSWTTTAGDQTWIVPATVFKILHMTYDDQWLTEFTATDMDRLTGGHWDGASGVPSCWFAEQTDDGMMIRFDCTFAESGKTVQYWFLKRAADLSADGDLTTLYKAVAPALVYRALMLSEASDGDGRQYQIWKAEYEGALRDAQFNQDVQNESDAPEAHDPYGWTG
jgi:hypothetical protein